MRHNVILLAFLAVLAGTAAAQWQNDGVPLYTAIDTYEKRQKIVTDKAGGAIICWMDLRNTLELDIYAQRIDDMGFIQWAVDGVPLCIATGNQWDPVMVPDGSGGAIVAWEDTRGGTSDIYAQRVNSAGEAQWAAGGVVICSTASNQKKPTVLSDGSGGAIIAWYDFRSGNYDIYAQRIDGTGVAKWTENGVIVCAAAATQMDPVLVGDGAGGVLLAWEDNRNGTSNTDIFAQRIDSSGTALWAADGVAIATATGYQSGPDAVSDGIGGMIVSWTDSRSGDYNIYAQRITRGGTILWTENGEVVCAAASTQDYPTIESEGRNGSIIAWRDSRTGEYDVYAQRVDKDGSARWTANGVAACSAAGSQQIADIMSDGLGGVIIAWTDARNGFLVNDDIYLQRVDSVGAVLWDADGQVICQAAGNQRAPQMASDGSGGALVVWTDLRLESNHIYAQRVGCIGTISEPYIRTVKDVPNDQGGLVELQWDASCVDVLPGQDVKFYSVWRDVDAKELDLLRSQGISRVTPGQVAENFQGQAYRADGKGYYWYWLGNVAARQHEGYSFPAPTLCDSGPDGKVYHYFMVSAQTADSGIYWDSEADSGYSVDNIAPAKALLLEGRLLKGPKADIRLDWNRETVADLWRYGVYRDVSSGFTPGPGNLVCYSDDTTEADAPTAACYYKVTAFDIHGNEGAPSNEWYFDGSTAVQLSMFAAMELEDGRVSVRWRTESEESCLRWEVERSGDPSSNYQLLGTVAGQGSTSQPTDYRYDDESELGPGTYYYRLGQVDLDGGKRYYGPVSLSYKWRVPAEAGVSGARPNPFNQTTTISYQTTTSGPVSLKVYNVYGQLVRTLGSGTKPAGYHRARWDGRSDRGEAVSAGVYLVRLEGVGISTSARVAVVR